MNPPERIGPAAPASSPRGRPARLLAACAAAAVLAWGCAAGRGAPAPLAPAGGWASPLERAHPLAGLVWDTARARAIAPEALLRDLARSDVVLLGEQHDNRDHHALQAWLLAGLARGGARPAVVFEQLDAAAQARIDAALAASGPTAAERAGAVAEAADWAASGWPPFDDYRPVFEAATAAGLAIRAAGLPRSVFAGDASVSEAAGRYGPAQRPVLEAEIRDSHCGMAPPAVVGMMMGVQARRDEALARKAAAADGDRRPRAVVVCGFGHARRDVGVPFVLDAEAPALRVASVAFVEARPGLVEPGAYAAPLHASRLPFDYVVFTPRADDEDPCEKFRASLERMKAR